ncbi:hypothetical protein P43SY_001452 [Pythium insidiosum]|uniref:Spindle pole body component n=1 Tax=Pythium insidiosum TaxID=114742 RepID=A0AAD5LMU4_PYTIN|nr:hypothetical protein P43SY_001452 [Pythium insidiosum]
MDPSRPRARDSGHERARHDPTDTRLAAAIATPSPAPARGAPSTAGSTTTLSPSDPLTPESRAEVLRMQAQQAARGAFNAVDMSPIVGPHELARGTHYTFTPNTHTLVSSQRFATPQALDSASQAKLSSFVKTIATAQQTLADSRSSATSSLRTSVDATPLSRSASASSLAAASSSISMSTATSNSNSAMTPAASTAWRRGSGSSEAALGLSSGSFKAEETKEPSRCGAEILYQSTVRLRLNNQQCLRISTTPPSRPADDAAQRMPSSAGGAAPTASQPEVFIDVAGNGLGDDPDQVFMLYNAENRSSRARVQFSDTVALYCVEGSCRGRFLSLDPTTQQLRVRRGPVITNNEKWRLVNPRVPAAQRARPSSQLFSESLGGSLPPSSLESAWEHDRAIGTSDAVMLQAYNAELLLSARRSSELSRAHVSIVAAAESESDAGDDRLVQQWELTKTNIPYDPAWNRSRGYLTGDALVQRRRRPRDDADAAHVNVPPLSSYPPSAQEALLVDDLLYSFVGIEGRYVTLEVNESTAPSAFSVHRSFRFTLPQSGMDPSLSALAARCFPLGEHYLSLVLYVDEFSRYEQGQVSHAFAAALKTLLKEYTVVVAQLEHQLQAAELTLQRLWFFVQPSLRTMETLRRLTDACRHSGGGGALLSEIQRMSASLAGDSAARQLFSFLLERASQPYLAMLERWIYHGDLVDPYDEFMVRGDATLRHEDLTQDPYSTYWDERFTLRPAQVPLFLSRVARKVLAAGKSLNIFRACERPLACPFAAPIAFADREAAYNELIDRAHAFASRALLQLIVQEHDLAGRLASLKHYFLMDQGDVFGDFLDAARAEMKLLTTRIAVSRLESLLHMSLQTSTCASDPYRDDLQCLLSPMSLLDQLNTIHERAKKAARDALSASTSSGAQDKLVGIPVVSAFNLDLRVRWPLSLVISCGALSKYQMLFRHLFYCKHVGKLLGDAWLTHQSVKELAVRAEFGRSFCLRQRMLHFQQNLLYYMTVEVISPRWHAFQRQLAAAETLDDILQHHVAFLDLCLKECLLSDPDLLRMIYLLMTHCATFVEHLEQITKPYLMDEETIKSEREDMRDRRAEKRAKAEADAAMQHFHRGAASGGGGGAGLARKKPLKRRESSYVDMRRQRIKAISDDLKMTVSAVDDGDAENHFRRRTSDLENLFDSSFREFMNQLIRRSRLEKDAHLSNLCTRLDYNGYYTASLGP